MKVAKWGNSLAVRIPIDVARTLALEEGDDVLLRPLEGNALEIAKIARREAAIAALEKYRGIMPDDYKFDREEANARR
jgi:antitoxin MazE